MLHAPSDRGNEIMAGEANSWNALLGRYVVKRINHQIAYSLDGACTNQAESFFSRMRRAERGHHHRIVGTYLARYAQESAWREGHRRDDNGRQVRGVTCLALLARPSVDFVGIGSGNKSLDFSERYPHGVKRLCQVYTFSMLTPYMLSVQPGPSWVPDLCDVPVGRIMSIVSHAFGRVTLTEGDAKKFTNQVRYGKPKKAAIESVKRGVEMAKSFHATGSVNVVVKAPSSR